MKSPCTVMSYTPFTQSKRFSDHDPEDVPVLTGHSLFDTTKCNTVVFLILGRTNSNMIRYIITATRD